MKKLILKSFQSPGDIVMMTAAVRDLCLAHGRKYQVDVRTSAAELWENNPHLTRLSERRRGVETIDMQYPLIHQSNTRPFHFIHAYTQFLEERLGCRIPVTKFHGDIHLSDLEKSWMSQVEELDFRGRFWIIIAGGKHDFTAKWWNPRSYQQVVDRFLGRIQFVQCGEPGHWHPPLKNVINFVGKTDLRQFVRLMHHADGVVCPVTFAMHLAAAVETRPDRPRNRACVVIAGGREPPQWEAYPHHQFISTNGALMCCDNGGCWKSRCQLVGDGDEKDEHDLCLKPVDIRTDLRIPQCMDMITADDVIRRIEMYYEGGALQYNADAADSARAVG
ncbi:MAG: glycosyltransferase family 9 protein [Pirellulaceae bacterium]